MIYMESFQFQRTKKRQATEDNAAGEQKNYCLVLNSNDRVAGTTHNQAEFNIPFEFLPHNYEYYKMDYAFVSTAGVYRDSYSEFGGTTLTPDNILVATLFDNLTPSGSLNIPGAKVTTTDTSLTLPENLRILANRTGLSTGGQYQLNQTISPITTTTFSGSMANGTNIITGVAAGTPIIGRFITATGLTNGARVLYQDPTTPTTWYVSKGATAAISGLTFTQYIPFTTRLNNTVANISVDFGCKKFIYDTDAGQSGFMGSVQRYTGSTLSGTNFYRSWWDEQCPQIINMGNFSGSIRTRITNGDGFLLEDSTAPGFPLGDMTPWQLFLSFTPIPSSAIETQCY